MSELDCVFSSLRSEVEGLFLQAPSVDLDALGGQLSTLEALIDEQSSIVQVGGAVLCWALPRPEYHCWHRGDGVCVMACLLMGLHVRSMAAHTA